MFPFISLAIPTVYAILASALKFPISRSNVPQPLSIRNDVPHDVSDPSDPFNFRNFGNNLYVTTIHINGQPFEVSLDTGSSDLWIDSAGVNLTGSIDIGLPASITYEDSTSANGNLTLIDMTWGNYTVKNQIFTNAPGSNATHGRQKNGLLGLGPYYISLAFQVAFLQNASNTSYAYPLINNIFSQHPDKPSYMTFLLSRGPNSSAVSDGGEFTIGETVKGHEAILNAPKLPVIYQTGRWISLVDGLTVNGEPIVGSSVGLGGISTDLAQIPVPEGKFTAVFDTGVSSTVLPRRVVDRVFQDVTITKLNGQEYVDCNTKINLSIIVGDLEYPIHPLDLVTPVSLNEDGGVLCEPNLVPIDSDAYGDFQFGDVVLRNLYPLYEFGNYTGSGNTQPYIQIISVTDKEKAWLEFDTMQKARVEGYKAAFSDETSANDTNTIASVSSSTSLSSTRKSSSTSPSSKDLSAAGALSNTGNHDAPSLNSLIRNSYIIIGLLVATIILAIGVVLLAFVRKLAPRSSNQRYKEMVPPTESEALSRPSGRYSD